MTLRRLIEKILRLVRAERRKYRGLRGVGQAWEMLAAKHLEREGYVIRARNVRTRAGEIDLVAEEEGVLCFVEVKGRKGTGFGLPEEAVTLEKQRRIFRAAQAYLQRERLEDASCRFDVVSVLEKGTAMEISVVRDAFRGPLPPRPRDWPRAC